VAKYPKFAAWLESERAAADMTVTDFASHLGVSVSMTSNYLAGKQRPERKSLRKIAAARKVERAFLEELLDADEPAPPPPIAPDVVARPAELAQEIAEHLFGLWVRRQRGEEIDLPLGSAGPGTPADAAVWQPIVSSIRHGRLFPVEVVGDCLAPRLQPGWICWINQDAKPRPGTPDQPRDVVLALIDGERVFKELVRFPDRKLYLTARTGLAPIEVTAQTEIIGVVDLVQHSP
jgi:transcriptional regulator with XRE-family HTH domain